MSNFPVGLSINDVTLKGGGGFWWVFQCVRGGRGRSLHKATTLAVWHPYTKMTNWLYWPIVCRSSQSTGWLMCCLPCVFMTEYDCCYFQSEFGGFCPLYGTANCSDEKSNETSVISCSFVAGRSSVCSFITMSNVLACVLYALGCFGYLAYLVHRSRVMIRVAYVVFFVLT